MGRRNRIQRLLWADGMYDGKVLDNVYIDHYGARVRMCDTPPTNISACKVAVTAGDIRDGTPFLITSYSCDTPPNKNSGGLYPTWHRILF